MQTKATTVDAYLKNLPEDRRAAIEAVRRVILKNLPKGYEEGMQYGMIGYGVPHSIYPAGYHCDPKQPLPYAGLASQKNHMALYLNCIYSDAAEEAWFRKAWTADGRKLDMGKSCIRFKKLEDVPLDVVGQAIKRTPVKKLIEMNERSLAERSTGARGGGAKKSAKKAAKKAAKKVAKKATAKASGAEKKKSRAKG